LLGGRRGGAWVRCLGWGGSGCPTHLSPTPPPLPKKTKKDGRARSFRHRAPAWWSSAPVSSPRSMSRPRRLLAGLGLDTCRIQFTPDLMPFDILSSEVLDEVGAAKGRDRQRALPRSARLVRLSPGVATRRNWRMPTASRTRRFATLSWISCSSLPQRRLDNRQRSLGWHLRAVVGKAIKRTLAASRSIIWSGWRW